jgi:hypothetical protein
MPNGDYSTMSESSAVRVLEAACQDNHKEAISICRDLGVPVWEGRATVSKFAGDSTDDADLYEIVHGTPNLLVYGGASALWERLIGNSTPVAYSNANAYLGVGDSTTAAVNTQTDLQAATNKLYTAMDATFPLHTDGTSSANASCQFRCTVATGSGNYAWQEWAVFNASSSGRMLQRKVESLGTKTSASTWQLLVTLTLA